MRTKLLSIFPLLLFISQISYAQVNPKDVTIIRDNYGVPHIYGKTDADMVYGLAWAACEDNFMVMQENFLAVKGRLARIKGKEGAIMDVLAHVTQAEDQAEVIHQSNPYSPAFKIILKAYVQALNDYV
ncbi:MAG: penicillin acylase family protein, partial [Saprospiraceae bacterium]